MACFLKWGKRWWGFGMQWHKLDHIQTICTLLQTDNHTNTSSLNFYRPYALHDTQPTVSKHWRQLKAAVIWQECSNTSERIRPHDIHITSITNKAHVTELTHTHTFNGHFSGTTQVSWYQKGKPIWILLKQETVSGSGIHWAICKSAPRSRQITTPEPHHSVFTDRMPFLPPNQQRQSTEGIM